MLGFSVSWTQVYSWIFLGWGWRSSSEQGTFLLTMVDMQKDKPDYTSRVQASSCITVLTSSSQSESLGQALSQGQGTVFHYIPLLMGRPESLMAKDTDAINEDMGPTV